LKASPKPKADTATQISELSASAAARDEGNAAFRKGQWKAAETHYSRALELATAAKKEKGEQGEGNQDMDADDDASASESVSAAAAADDDDDAVAAANNRAAARLKLGDSAGALADAESVLRLRPSDVKARLRRAAALEALGGDDGGKRAGEDYKFVLRLEPRNTQALKGMEKIKGKKPAV
jgi:tetratricopeptide (TPR) repeat protein